MSIGKFPEGLRQAILVGIILAGRLGARLQDAGGDPAADREAAAQLGGGHPDIFNGIYHMFRNYMLVHIIIIIIIIIHHMLYLCH